MLKKASAIAALALRAPALAIVLKLMQKYADH